MRVACACLLPPRLNDRVARYPPPSPPPLLLLPLLLLLLTTTTTTTQERAFFSALRALLADISSVPDPSERATRSSAAHKWFSKHRPRGQAEDPAIFAAMAASLSLGGLQQQPFVGLQAVREQYGSKAFAAQVR